MRAAFFLFNDIVCFLRVFYRQKQNQYDGDDKKVHGKAHETSVFSRAGGFGVGLGSHGIFKIVFFTWSFNYIAVSV